MSRDKKIGIYFHWPFCLAKCPYCDFNVHIRETVDQEAWREAYLKALGHYAQLAPGYEIASVFFGGGTPSLMAPETVKAVLEAIGAYWTVSPDMEVTLEANPTSVEAGKFKAFRDAGINRVSLGIQSLNDEDLKFLGRRHNSEQALTAIATARSLFDRFSFDLIYARPGQSLAQWEDELKRALEHEAGHMSLYQLTIERSTPFYLDQAQGKFTMPEEGMAADFYHLTQDIMEAADLPAYETSNHARAGEESRHNLIYWRYGDYIGIGPGAHGRLAINGEKFATREHSAPDIWIQRMHAEGHGYHPFDPVPPRERFLEALMMGLRLREGVPVERLEKEAKGKIEDLLDLQKLEKMTAENWLLYDGRSLSVSREGMLRLNVIIPYILKN